MATVEVTVADGVAILELNRPDQNNAIDLELADALADAVEAAAADDAVRVLLLRGSGRMFCPGGDLAAMDAAPDRGAFLQELADAAHRAIRALDAIEKPVVAAVHGSAAGAGVSLALASDIVLVGSKARFAAAYGAVGLTPDCGMSWLLPRAVGTQRAMEFTLLLRVLKADEAVAWGMATTVVEDDQLQAEAEAVARRIASGAAGAFGKTRRLIRASRDVTLGEHLDVEAATISAASATEESGALIAAFLKR